MNKRLWNVGMKCPDLKAELEFNRKMGHEIVIEKESVQIGGKEQFQALVRIGDKYLVVAEEWGLEQFLPEEFAYGATHMSHSVDDIDSAVRQALDAGATLLHGPDQLEAPVRATHCRLFPLPRRDGLLHVPGSRASRSRSMTVAR